MKSVLILLSILLRSASICQSDTKSYTEVVNEILLKRAEFKTLYENSDLAQKSILIIKARKYLNNKISKEIFPFWYGTRWDFNGTTRTPGKGNIACGYFVTNTLTDLGFNIPRIKWAQSASEVFIKKLAGTNVKRFSNQPLLEIKKHLFTAGDGIYLVGLDIHVGFIVVEDHAISFVHSSYYQPEIGVMSESIDSKNPLSDSSYRVVGKLMSDEMIVNWILNNAYD